MFSTTSWYLYKPILPVSLSTCALISNSKPYFPGAHAYRVNKTGADLLINGIKNAKPTDVYLNKHLFPWLEEYHPWPVACKDSFTTIQKEAGCLAKHNWNENYEII